MRRTIQICLILALCLAVARQVAARRPNVIVFLTDDQGWGDLSINGNSNLSTPNVDSLARDGVMFENFYVCAVCAPTRAEFLTGRYHPRTGVSGVSTGQGRLNIDETTIADVFKSAGYATGAFGKWHNGTQSPYHPNDRGFDEYYGFTSGHWGHYFSPPLDHNGRKVRGKGYVVDDFTDHALKFIEDNRDQPFFVYVPYNTPHSPMMIGDEFYDKFKDLDPAMKHRDPKNEDVMMTRAALAMCENIDWNVGRVLKKLDELKLRDNTIVLYFCDNGPNGVRWNSDMKGRKGSTDEGGVRSPMLIRWPGRIKGGTKITQLGAAIDLLPTLADAADIPVASRKPLDGISLKPALLGKTDSAKNRVIFSHWRGKVSVRTPQYRLDHQGKLYDMHSDPGQRRDISKENPKITTRLQKAVDNWKSQMPADYGQDDRPFVIGHPGYRFTQIPARDGTAHGNIKRSNRFPNCSYFTNWTSLDDSITWEAEVGATGNYEVELHYPCPQADVGSEFELSFNDDRLTGTITEAHDPPVKGGEHDRVTRGESYVKDFKAMKLGTIHLKKGPGTLTLQATKMPGSQVMDFRLLMLKRVGS